MSNYVIFFTEKEGTSALVSLLANFEEIESIPHEILEPFFVKKPIPSKDLGKILNALWTNDFCYRTFEKVYSPYSLREVAIQGEKPRGFKMRYYQRLKKDRLQELLLGSYTKMMMQTIKQNDVKVFFSVRQDLLRWALSKYHGDGTGRPGHLQFAVASGKLKKEDIPNIYVSPLRLRLLITRCRAIHLCRRHLYQKFKKAGIATHVLRYEDFIESPSQFLQSFFEALTVSVTKESIQKAIKAGTRYKKVHSDDIREFVINHEEITTKFGNSFFAWPD